MAINFTSMNNNTTPVEVSPVSSGVSLNLTKNSVLDLTKAAPSLNRVKLCAGWDVAACGSDFDLDISVFMLNNNGKITSGSDVVFYNNPSVRGVSLNGDNRTGRGDGDDETIDIDLNELASSIDKIVCCVTIDQAIARRQTFGMVNHSYVRLVNADTNKELCKFELKDNGSTDTAMVFAELVRNGNAWAFHTIGEGKNADLNGLAAMFS